MDDEVVALLTAVRRTGLIHGGSNSAEISEVPKGLICASQTHARFGDDL